MDVELFAGHLLTHCAAADWYTDVHWQYPSAWCALLAIWCYISQAGPLRRSSRDRPCRLALVPADCWFAACVALSPTASPPTNCPREVLAHAAT